MHTKYVAVKRHDIGDLLQNTIAKEKKKAEIQKHRKGICSNL